MKMLVPLKYAVNDFSYHFGVTEGKQIVVPYIYDNKVNKNVKKHTILVDCKFVSNVKNVVNTLLIH